MTLDVNVNVDVNKILAELEAVVRETAPHVWAAALHQAYANMWADIVAASMWLVAGLILASLGLAAWRTARRRERVYQGVLETWKAKTNDTYAREPNYPESVTGFQSLAGFVWLLALGSCLLAGARAIDAMQIVLAPDWAAIQIVRGLVGL